MFKSSRRFFSRLLAAVSALFALVGLSGCGAVERLLNKFSAARGASSTSEALDGGTAARCDMALMEWDCDVSDDQQGSFNTEEYDVVVEHGFTSVASKPFSTFAADVDTASYCNLRRMIREGRCVGEIPDGAVRIEEMLNYFDYPYALPEEGELFGMTASVADCPWNPSTKLLVMGLRTRDLDYGEMAEEVGNNLVFLIDISGSMDDPDKLGLVKKSFRYLVDRLAPGDLVSIVTYAGGESVVLDGVRAQERDLILEAVDGLEAGGSTNGEAGLSMAYDIAESHFIAGGNNRIVMASDGDLNVGISSKSELSDFVASKRDTGIYLSVLGFGSGNYSDSRMETLADDGNGLYLYIDCAEEARRVFDTKLCSSLVTVAQDVKLQMEFNPAYVKGYRQIGYENRVLSDDDFKNDAVDAGEVGAGMCLTIAYELVMADSDLELFTSDSRYGNGQAIGEKNGEWCCLSVRYREPGSDEAQQRAYPVGEDLFTDVPDDDWRFAASVIEFGMLLRQSENLGTTTPGGLVEYLAGTDLHGNELREEFCGLVEAALVWEL